MAIEQKDIEQVSEEPSNDLNNLNLQTTSV